VIVHEIDFVSVPIFQSENDPPVLRNRHAPESPPVAAKLVKAIAREIHVGGAESLIKVHQYVRNSTGLIRAKQTGIAISIKQP